MNRLGHTFDLLGSKVRMHGKRKLLGCPGIGDRQVAVTQTLASPRLVSVNGRRVVHGRLDPMGAKRRCDGLAIIESCRE